MYESQNCSRVGLECEDPEIHIDGELDAFQKVSADCISL